MEKLQDKQSAAAMDRKGKRIQKEGNDDDDDDDDDGVKRRKRRS
jgi:hypothetical protein